MCFSCFASENGVMLPAPPDSLQTWRPRAIDYRVMCDSLNRVGGMLNRYDIRRNIDLIRSLYPQVENIALVTDNTYGGISLQALVRAEWENYPDLNLVLVDSREGEETAFRTYATLPPRSAVMLGTWRVGSDGEYFMQRSLNDLVQNNPRVPVFSVTGTGIGDTAIGGYVPEYENGAEVIANQIRKYYDTDDIEDAHFHTSKSLYLFDSRKLKEWKIAEYALPKGSVIEDTMAAKLSKYSHYIELLVAGILLLVLLLTIIGLVMLFSASFPSAYYETGTPTYYFKRQAIYAAVGLAGLALAARFNYQRWRGASRLLLILSLFLLMLVIIPGIGIKHNNARRWLGIDGVFTFQPSEIAKLAVIVYFADSISKKREKMLQWREGIVPYAVILGVFSILMMLEPHLSGTILIVGTGAIMMAVGGMQRWLIGAGVGGVAAVAMLFVKLVEGGVQKQAEQAIKNIGTILESVGVTYADVVKTTCFLADIQDFGAFNEIYRQYFTGKPARSCFAVKDLPMGAQVEIEVIVSMENK